MNRSAILTPQIAPPEGYYQNNFRELLDFVTQRYVHVLPSTVAAHYRAALALADPAQRLLARLLCRKGPAFRLDGLAYAEIADNTAAADMLVEAGLAERCPRVASDVLLKLVRKAELQQWFDLGPRGSHVSKADLLESIQTSYSERAIGEVISAHVLWVTLRNMTFWDLARFLYFDDPHQDWSAFVIRDLGLVEYEDVALGEVTLSCARELEEMIEALRMNGYSHRVKERPQLCAPLLDFYQHVPAERSAQRRRERALLRVGQGLERDGQMALAMTTYAQTPLHPSRERRVRIADKQGNNELRDRLLEAIGQQAVCAEETLFATRFGKRKAGYQPPEEVVYAPEVRKDVEAQVLALLLARAPRGTWGCYVENALVRSLTGLVYWPVIFAEVPGAFTHPFQNAPHDLWEDDFVDGPRKGLVAGIEALDDADFAQHLQAVCAAKQGRANALVSWGLLEELGLELLLQAMGLADIRKLTGYLIRNLAWRRRGMPDLLLCYGPGAYELVEVKGPNDQLQMQQRVWFEVFAELGIPAKVVKLKLAPAG
ncbi:MAG: VRR-NUC domain-containing protein [Pseudomonadota bacterium]